MILEIILIVWYWTTGLLDLGAGRVTSVSGLVIQLVSFWGAAYFGGMFLYGSIVLQKTGEFPVSWWIVWFDAFIGFGGSGVFALASALTGTSWYLLGSICLLLYAVFVCLVVLMQLHWSKGQQKKSGIIVGS